ARTGGPLLRAREAATPRRDSIPRRRPWGPRDRCMLGPRQRVRPRALAGGRSMDLGLKGKTALVTASSKGMGKACALGLAAEGARVVMCARTERDLSAAADEVRAKSGGDVLAVPADVTRADDVKTLLARARERFGGIDVLVAN